MARVTNPFSERDSEGTKVRTQVAGNLWPGVACRAVGRSGALDFSTIQSGVALRLPPHSIVSHHSFILISQLCNLAHHKLANLFVSANMILPGYKL